MKSNKLHVSFFWGIALDILLIGCFSTTKQSILDAPNDVSTLTLEKPGMFGFVIISR